MNSQTQNEHKPVVSRLTGSLIGGIILILLGLFALLESQLHFDLGMFVLPILGIAFLAWGLLSRSSGLLIPGGVLLGIGTGVFLADGLFSYLPDEQNAGVILCAFAAGWVLTSLLSIVVERDARKMMWWPLIPAAVLALVGASILLDGIFSSVLNLLSLVWPIVLIGIGLYLILRRNNSQ